MTLNAGEIDSIMLYDYMGEYVLFSNSDYYIRGLRISPFRMGVALGFIDKVLRDKVNSTLYDMKESGRLYALIQNYIVTPNVEKTVEFTNFPNSETLKVAVTGDIPPLDYIAPDGTHSGFNVAILAEIGRRLQMNIKLLNIESTARAAALSSGRADCIFWFETIENNMLSLLQLDIPEGILLSDVYYSWNKVFFIGKKR